MHPSTFDHELKLKCGPNYRLVRSLEKPRWRIEQRIMRGIAGVYGGDNERCKRDGTACIIDSADSDLYRCPECNSVTVLEAFETKEYRCACGRTFKESYFPLVDRSIIHLERTHPRRGLEVIREIDAANRRLDLSHRSDLRTHAEACASDRWREVSGGVMVGYTKPGTPHAYGS